MTIAIIGAGIAGLTAARALADAGCAVAVFDKSARPGGRMATRVRDGWQFDHGAVSLSAERPAFQAALSDWRARGLVAAWEAGQVVGVPGMNSPPRDWAAVLPVAYNTQVSGLQRVGSQWLLTAATGSVGMNGTDAFDAVILAVPAPQAEALAQTAGQAMPALGRAQYAPCWTLMVAFDAPFAEGADDVWPADDMISRVVRDGRKAGRTGTGERVVAHATADWSRQHLELSSDAVAALLLRRVLALMGLAAAPTHVSAHRWRYGLVEQAAGVACVWDGAQRLGACGDWCLGPRVEDAFDSGAAMAKAVRASV